MYAILFVRSVAAGDDALFVTLGGGEESFAREERKEYRFRSLFSALFAEIALISEDCEGSRD